MADMTKIANPDQIPDEPANRDLARGAKAQATPATFEEKVEALDRFIHFEPLFARSTTRCSCSARSVGG